MKKFTGWLLLAMMWMTACEGPMGPAGPPGQDGVGDWYVFDIDVYSDMWKPIYDEYDNLYYECRVSRASFFNKISQSDFEFIFDEGLITGYLVQWVRYDGGAPVLVQSLLPYTIYGDDGEFLYSENYSFEVLRTGYITFTVKYSDFAEVSPGDCNFHMVMIW